MPEEVKICVNVLHKKAADAPYDYGLGEHREVILYIERFTGDLKVSIPSLDIYIHPDIIEQMCQAKYKMRFEYIPSNNLNYQDTEDFHIVSYDKENRNVYTLYKWDYLNHLLGSSYVVDNSTQNFPSNFKEREFKSSKRKSYA